MDTQRLNFILREWENQARKINLYIDSNAYDLPSKIEKVRRQLDNFTKRIRKKAGGKLDFSEFEERYKFAVKFEIPFTGIHKFLTAEQEIDSEKSVLTRDEQVQFYKKNRLCCIARLKKQAMQQSPSISEKIFGH